MLMTFIQRFGSVPGHQAIIRERNVLLAIPVGGIAVCGKNLGHLKNGRQPSMGVAGIVSAFHGHVSDDVFDTKSRGELIRAAQAGDRRELIFEVGFSANRSIDKRRNGLGFRADSSFSGERQRAIGVDEIMSCGCRGIHESGLYVSLFAPGSPTLATVASETAG